MNKIIVYVPQVTPRLSYSLDFIFGFLSLSYKTSTSSPPIDNDFYPHLYYAPTKIDGNHFFIPATSLLFETSLNPSPPTIHQLNGLPFFFKTTADGDFPFDLFSVVFYLLSRYEEYLPSKKDIHQRFPASQSLAAQHGFLQMPLIDIWLLAFKKKLASRFPSLEMKTPSYQHLSSIDVDMAWRFKHKSLGIHVAASARDFLLGKWRNLKERWQTLLGKRADDFDTFAWINEQHAAHQTQSIFFFLLGKYSLYNKNNSPKNKYFQTLIRSIQAKCCIGLHPSYQTPFDVHLLQSEVAFFEAITRQKPSNSRQHFLRLCLPDTYRHLIAVGINNDFSMGFADALGFRASTAQSFFWYDLLAEKATALRIFPFQVMDVTLKNHCKYSPETAILQIQQIIEACKQVGGTFISIWHNSSFETSEWGEAWKDVYLSMLAAAQKS